MKAAASIPGASTPSYWKSRRFAELCFCVPPIIGAIVVTIRLWGEPSLPTWLGPLSAFGIVWLVIGAALKISAAAKADQKDAPDIVHEGLYAAVATLQAMLSHYCEKVGCGGDIRATFHRVVPPIDDPEHIEQIIPYVGTDDGGMGRKFAIGMGITGRAIRQKSALIMSSESPTEKDHRTELISRWGYTEARASALKSGRYSAAALPILGDAGRRTLGVVYLDSSERAVFEREDVLQILGVGCDAISNFVTRRY